jgi:hypothetical protein
VLLAASLIHFSSVTLCVLLRTELAPINNWTALADFSVDSLLSLCCETGFILVIEPPHRPHRKHIRLHCWHVCTQSLSLRFHCCFTGPSPSNALSSTLQYYIWASCFVYVSLTHSSPSLIQLYIFNFDRLCGLVVRFPGYRAKDPGFDSRRYHISQITIAHMKSSQSAVTSRFLAKDLNNGDSSAPVLTSYLSTEYPTTGSDCQLTSSLAYDISERTKQKKYLDCCMLIRCRANVFTEPWRELVDLEIGLRSHISLNWFY